MKDKIRIYIRRILKIRENESISDGIERQYYHILKRLPHACLSAEEFVDGLEKVGICDGDVVIVHASWRALYMLEITPTDVLNLLIKKVGENGTLLMPCYGSDNSYFDVNSTKSVAGVLSECFRSYPNVQRSVFPKFSMCGCGKYAKEILLNHTKSTYQFDEYSPYSIATKRYNAKILLLGMGEKPHKITVFHCASYDSRAHVEYYKKCYSREVEATIVSGSDERRICYVDRMPGYNNNQNVFRGLFKLVPKKIVKKKGACLISFYATDAYDIALTYCLNGGKIYTKG